MRLFVTEAEAVAAGMTHHGRLFGARAWVRVKPSGFEAKLRCPIAVVWCAVVWRLARLVPGCNLPVLVTGSRIRPLDEPHHHGASM